jgi:hypothetical protein
MKMDNTLKKGGTAKKRKKTHGESKSKKRKLEKLVDWGEVTEMEFELNVRDWLVSQFGIFCYFQTFW